MQSLFARVLSAKRKKLFGTKAIFQPYKQVSEVDLQSLEGKLGCALPDALRGWLLEAGFGDLNDDLSFRADWFSLIDRGPLKGHLMFAQDCLGNFYSIAPSGGDVHYICRHEPTYALMASDFIKFLEALEKRDFDILGWIDSIATQPYDWSIK